MLWLNIRTYLLSTEHGFTWLLQLTLACLLCGTDWLTELPWKNWVLLLACSCSKLLLSFPARPALWFISAYCSNSTVSQESLRVALTADQALPSLSKCYSCSSPCSSTSTGRTTDTDSAPSSSARCVPVEYSAVRSCTGSLSSLSLPELWLSAMLSCPW